MADDIPGSKPMTKNSHEIFAMKRGYEGLTQREAYLACGLNERDPRQAGAKMKRIKGMTDRVNYLRELRVQADMTTAIKSREQILVNVQNNAVDAASDKQFSASNAAYKMLGGEVHGMFRDKVEMERPGRALKDRSLKSIAAEIEELIAELGLPIEFDLAAFLTAGLGAAEEAATGVPRLAEGVEGIEDQPLQPESEAEGVPQSGPEIQGTDGARSESIREDVVRWSGDDVSLDGAVPGLVEGPQIHEAD